jgi:hypothetical protein
MRPSHTTMRSSRTSRPSRPEWFRCAFCCDCRYARQPGTSDARASVAAVARVMALRPQVPMVMAMLMLMLMQPQLVMVCLAANWLSLGGMKDATNCWTNAAKREPMQRPSALAMVAAAHRRWRIETCSDPSVVTEAICHRTPIATCGGASCRVVWVCGLVDRSRPLGSPLCSIQAPVLRRFRPVPLAWTKWRRSQEL